MGEGLPFVHMPWFRMSHIQMEWQIPEYRHWYDMLLQRRRLIRYDERGIGLSDRDVNDYSPDALMLDLEAVVDRLGLEKFALFGLVHTGPVAIAYAARHPDRVSHLILWCSYARSSDYARSAQVLATRGVMDTDWETYTQTMAHVRLGWAEGGPARQFAALMRESITPQALQSLIDAYSDLDVTPLLSQIKAPTLVLHRRRLPWLDARVARNLAAAIPGASLTILEGSLGAPYLEEPEGVVRAIYGFLGDPFVAPAGRERSLAGGLVTILFTDVEGSTPLTDRLGDSAAREVLREARAHNP